MQIEMKGTYTVGGRNDRKITGKLNKEVENTEGICSTSSVNNFELILK